MRLRNPILCAICTVASLAAASDKIVGETLSQAGAQVKFDGDNIVSVLFSSKSKDDPRDPTPEQLELVGHLAHLRALTIYNNCGATDRTLEFIDGLGDLEIVSINALKTSDAGLAHFAKLKNLKKLTLWHCFNKEFNGSGSEYLAGLPKLESFACSGSTFNDEGLKACAKLKQVSTLQFHHTMATDAGLAYLKGLTNLKNLMLSTQYTVRIGDAGLESIADIPNLERLELNETLLTYDGGLKHLKKMKKLKNLIMTNTEIAADDMTKLKADLPKVQIGWSKPTPQIGQQMKDEIAKKNK